MSDKALIIFIKNPILGKAKTRIAQTVGKEKALQVYLELLDHTRKITEKVDACRFLFYSDFVDHADHWNPRMFQKAIQEGKGLGEKMSNAFETILQTHQQAVIIGSDCASLTSEIITDAFDALDKKPYVLGPAKDGGYYLLGMNQHSPYLFQDILWSTSTVTQKTIEKIETTGKKYALLPTLSDIDYWEDWLEYGWEIVGSEAIEV